MKEIIDKMDFIKIQIFYSVKGNVPEMRREATDWENICKRHIRQRTIIQNIARTLKIQ